MRYLGCTHRLGCKCGILIKDHEADWQSQLPTLSSPLYPMFTMIRRVLRNSWNQYAPNIQELDIRRNLRNSARSTTVKIYMVASARSASLQGGNGRTSWKESWIKTGVHRWHIRNRRSSCKWYREWHWITAVCDLLCLRSS